MRTEDQVVSNPNYLTIANEHIDLNALWVIKRLRAKGYEAYLTGGCVRDLLLAKTPKDFDVATNAKPEELKRIFRNCRLVGRRFLLAHIYFPEGKVVETATFRKNPVDVQEDMPEDLLVTQDNAYGNLQEDALRRDFTINGLFYDPIEQRVIDEVGGLDDLKAGIVRTIGNPDIRLREDPVRILRAMKFACRLGFQTEQATWEAMKRHGGEIVRCAPARVQEEMLRLLTCRHAQQAWQLCQETGVIQAVFPELIEGLQMELEPREGHLVESPAKRSETLQHMLKSLDEVLLRHAHVPSSVVFAVLLLPAYQALDASVQNERNWLDRLCVNWAERIRLTRHDQDRLRILLSSIGLLGSTMESLQKNQFVARKPWFRELILLYVIDALSKGNSLEPVHVWKALAARYGRLYKQDRQGRVRRAAPMRRKRPSFRHLASKKPYEKVPKH